MKKEIILELDKYKANYRTRRLDRAFICSDRAVSLFKIPKGAKRIKIVVTSYYRPKSVLFSLTKRYEKQQRYQVKIVSLQDNKPLEVFTPLGKWLRKVCSSSFDGIASATIEPVK